MRKSTELCFLHLDMATQQHSYIWVAETQNVCSLDLQSLVIGYVIVSILNIYNIQNIV